MAETSPTDSPRLKLAVLGLTAAYALANVVAVLIDEQYQWDFRMHWAFAKAYAAGVAPDDLDGVARVSGIRIPPSLPWPYPPHMLWVLRPLAALDVFTALKVFVGLKCVALAALVAAWRRFLGRDADWLFYPFAALAFSSAVFMDLNAGNYATFEQAFVWSGFACWLAGRDAAFGALVALGAAQKLVLAPLLGIPLLLRDRRRWVAPVVAGVAFGAGVLAVRAAWPELFAAWLATVRSIDNADERRMFNPAILPLLRDVFERDGHVRATYLAVAGIVLLASGRAWLAFRAPGAVDGDRRAIALACLTYALLIPRFKPYTYILLVAPAWLAIRSVRLRRADVVLAALFLLPTADLGIAALRPVQKVFWEYFPYFQAVGAWAILCFAELRAESGETKAAAEKGAGPPG